jgi:hypothetical protein
MLYTNVSEEDTMLMYIRGLSRHVAALWPKKMSSTLGGYAEPSAGSKLPLLRGGTKLVLHHHAEAL